MAYFSCVCVCMYVYVCAGGGVRGRDGVQHDIPVLTCPAIHITTREHHIRDHRFLLQPTQDLLLPTRAMSNYERDQPVVSSNLKNHEN